MKKVQAALRKAVLAFLGNRCLRCGITDERVLQVDHINGLGTRERRMLGTYGLYKKILQDLDHEHYQLLCANCNWIKRYEVGELKLQ